MDESILTFGQGGILASSVLVQMGIKIDQLNVDKKIKAVIDRFNDTYLETMDFLTQILPLAKEQFGRCVLMLYFVLFDFEIILIVFVLLLRRFNTLSSLS